SAHAYSFRAFGFQDFESRLGDVLRCLLLRNDLRRLVIHLYTVYYTLYRYKRLFVGDRDTSRCGTPYTWNHAHRPFHAPAPRHGKTRRNTCSTPARSIAACGLA